MFSKTDHIPKQYLRNLDWHSFISNMKKGPQVVKETSDLSSSGMMILDQNSYQLIKIGQSKMVIYVSNV